MPRSVADGDGVHGNGTDAPLTSIYPVENIATDWIGWATDDPQLILECRSAAWVAEVGRRVTLT